MIPAGVEIQDELAARERKGTLRDDPRAQNRPYPAAYASPAAGSVPTIELNADEDACLRKLFELRIQARNHGAAIREAYEQVRYLRSEIKHIESELAKLAGYRNVRQGELRVDSRIKRMAHELAELRLEIVLIEEAKAKTEALVRPIRELVKEITVTLTKRGLLVRKDD